MKKSLILITIGLFFWASIASAVTLIGINSGMRIEGRHLSDLDFSLSSSVVQHIISGVVISTSTVKDTLLQTTTGSVVDNNATVNVQVIVSPQSSAPTFISEDPNIATVDANGNVTKVTDGAARINTTINWLTRQISVPVSRVTGQTITQIIGYATSSLAKSDSNAIDALIASAGATTTSLRLFSTQDHTNAVYVRNTSNWLTAGGIDTTCIAVWNSAGGTQGAGVLITPRHIMLANHNAYGIGTTVRFVDSSNNLITATVLNTGNVAGTDIEVEVLSADVSSAITPCAILPANYLTYLPSITATTTIPAIGLLGGGTASNQSQHGLTHPDKMTTVRDLSFMATTTSPRFGLLDVQYQFPTLFSTTTRDAFYYDSVIGGDSGNPSFLLINNKLSLLTCWWGGGGGVGPSFPDNITGINNVIIAMGSDGGYRVSTTSLAGFNTY